jgi:hypothetical protein
VGVNHGMLSSNSLVLGDCLLFLSLCIRGVQDLLKVRPSSPLKCNHTIPRLRFSVTSLSFKVNARV